MDAPSQMGAPGQIGAPPGAPGPWHPPTAWAAPAGYAPLPPIPVIESPTAVFYPGPDTAGILARAVARRARLSWESVRSFAMVWLVYMAILWIVVGWAAIVVSTILMVLILPLRFAIGGGQERRLAAQYRLILSPGQVMAARFGPEAVEIQQFDSRIRLSYRDIRKLEVRDQLIMMRLATGYTAYPRELFPDYALDYVHSVLPNGPRPTATSLVPAPPPLPPLPPLNQPTAVYIALPDTAAHLAKSLTHRMCRSILILGGITALPMMLLYGAAARPGYLLLAAVTLVFLIGRAAWLLYSIPRMTQRISSYAAPGRQMAARFGPDAFDIHTATSHRRIPYAAIRSLTTRPDTVFLRSGPLLTAYPRALFPDHALAYIRTANPKLARRR